MPISEHEKNYTPSYWSKRYECKELLEHFVKFGETVTKNASETIKCDLKIPYDTTSGTYYDVYGTDLPEDAPIFVFIHGGYWQEGSPEMSAFAAPVFVANGIKVIILGYDLCPDVKVGDILSQIKKGIRQILMSVLSNEDRRVWIAGHSAGAYMTLALLYDKPWLDELAEQGCLNLIKGIVLISPFYDLKPLLDTTINHALQLTKEEAEMYSLNIIDIPNLEHIQRLKFIVSVGECESPTFIDASQKLAQELITVGDNVQYLLARDDTDHFDIVERLTNRKFGLTKLLLNDICKQG